MKRIPNYLFLIIIIAIAVALRFWQLGKVPVSPDWDEAALGYNAYSILRTGRDEYGTFLPLTLRSFDDYKPPLYAYLAIPAVAIWGLDTWVVRLPSAVMGILAVVGTYALVRELFGRTLFASRLALVASFLLAISPWHLQFSRIAFEANIGITLNIWAVTFFLWGLRRPSFMGFSAFLFGLGLYAYHSERIFLPLLITLLAIIFWRELWLNKKALVLGIVIGALTAAPLVPVFLSQNTLMRLRGTSPLADQTGLLAQSVRKLEEDQARGNPWGVVFDNRRIVWAKTILEGYLSHYSLRWLFLTGDNDRHHAPDTGLLYLWELPFLFWGLFVTARKGGRLARILLGWFLLAPIPASPTSELPHAIRTLIFLPTFQIFVSWGLLSAYQLIQRKSTWLVKGLVGVVLLFIALNIGQYFDLYFRHTNREFSRFWQYGYKEAVEYAQKNRAKYRKIVVSTKLEQPHMFFLYFTRYDPAKYLAEGGTASGGFAEAHNRFDIYEFRPINWDKEPHDHNVLYIGTVNEIMHPLTTINYLDNTIAISIGE